MVLIYIVVAIIAILLILALLEHSARNKYNKYNKYSKHGHERGERGDACSGVHTARRAADCDEGKVMRSRHRATCRSGGTGECGRPSYFPARKPYPAVPWTLPDEEAWYGVDLEGPPPDSLARLSERPGADYSDGAQIHLAYPHDMYSYPSLPDHDEPEGSLSYL
jgi:hypothetical protein